MRYEFLVESYASERLKVVSIWSEFRDEDLPVRPSSDPRGRSVHEHMVHQCVSEDTWMRTMLGIAVPMSALPSQETKASFLEHYAAVSADRLAQLESKPDEWFEEETGFFDVRRSRAWVLTRRLTHSAHHRGQLTVYLRVWGQALYSTYGPTADTGGLFQNQAQVVYRYTSIDELIERERDGGEWPPLPGPGEKSPTERP